MYCLLYTSFNIGGYLQDRNSTTKDISQIFQKAFVAVPHAFPAQYSSCLLYTSYIIADNTLWDGHVLEQPRNTDAQTIGIKAFNDLVAEDAVSYTHLDVYKRQQVERICTQSLDFPGYACFLRRFATTAQTDGTPI